MWYLEVTPKNKARLEASTAMLHELRRVALELSYWMERESDMAIRQSMAARWEAINALIKQAEGA